MASATKSKKEIALEELLKDSSPENQKRITGLLSNCKPRYFPGCADLLKAELLSDRSLSLEKACFLALGISIKTAQIWARERPAFKKEYEECVELARGSLIERAISGATPAGSALGILKMCYGMMEEDKRQAIELKRTELEARLNGTIKDQVVNITYSEATQEDSD